MRDRFPRSTTRDALRNQPPPEGAPSMDFGIGIATSHDSWKLAQGAEELSFTHA